MFYTLTKRLNLFASLSVEIILQIKLDIYTVIVTVIPVNVSWIQLESKLALLILTRINKSDIIIGCELETMKIL